MILVIVALLVSSSFAHMMMDKPCARSSPTCHSSGRKDYDLPAPLNYRPEPKIGGSFPCKSHTQQGSPTFTVRPGESIATRFTGSDNHDGGHCQFALSYDNGRTWAVVRTILHDCMSGRGTGPYSYSVPVPESAASGRVVLGWLFYNKEGDQEVYMNCADGEIQDGRSNGYIGGKELLVLRLNGYRKLGEWKYGGDDGVGMFNARRDVVIRANGRTTISSNRSKSSPSRPRDNNRPRGDREQQLRDHRDSSRREPNRNVGERFRPQQQHREFRSNRPHPTQHRQFGGNSRDRHRRVMRHRVDDDNDDDDE